MWDDLRYRLRALFRRGAVERELEEELQYHVEHQAAIYHEQGFSPEEALRRARLAFGGVERTKEECREARGLSLIEATSRDFRYAMRQCRKSPGFAAVAAVTLAIAIAANTAVFSFVRAIVIEKLPVNAAGRLVTVGQRNEAFHIDGSETAFSYSFYQELRSRETDFEDLLAVRPEDTKLTEGGETIPMRLELVSGNYFSMLGIRPAAGRLLDECDDAAEGAAGVCVISHRLWQERFAADAGVIGHRILVGGVPVEIVGVSQPGFAGVSLHEPREPGALYEGRAVPRLRARPNGLGSPSGAPETGSEPRTGPYAAGRDWQTDPITRGPASWCARYLPVGDGSQGIGRTKAQLEKPITLLLLLVGIVLLVACANLSALLLTRSLERARETGIRLALGASRAAVIRHILSEGLALSIAGGAAGWILAQLLVRMLLRLLGPEGEGLAPHVRPDLVIFGYSAGVTLAAGILVSLLPAWHSAHTDPLPRIHGTGTAGWRRPLATRTLVAAQIALSVVLIFGAGLFVQTLRNLRLGTRAFDAGQVVLAEVDLSDTIHERNPEPFFDELLRGARELPGVRAASLTQIRILSGGMMSIVLRIPGYRPSNGMSAATYFNTVSTGYFGTLGIPIVAGRDFASSDRGEGEGAVIVNEQFAREFLSNDALGRHFSYASGRNVHVVGIAANARYRGPREELQPIMYLPVTQWHFPRDLHLQVRTTQDSTAATAGIRALINKMDRSLPIGQISTMEMQIDRTLTRERLLALLSAILGSIATLLVGIGVCGVVSFSVARRVREIGVRIAMGSQCADILSLFLTEAVGTALVGIACGIPLALASGRLASSLLYGLKPGDALTAATAGSVLVLVAVMGALVPAWRAARLDPSTSLRCE
jgi:predicted permease